MPKHINFIGCTPFPESVDMSSIRTVQWTLEQKTFFVSKISRQSQNSKISSLFSHRLLGRVIVRFYKYDCIKYA